MISNLYGAFSVQYDFISRQGLAIIIPEMYPARVGITPSGAYHVNCIDLERGTVSFMIEQDEQGNWFSERQPPFITFEIVRWLGEQIQAKSTK